MKLHLKENIIRASAVGLVAWTILFLYCVTHVVYVDHMDLVAANQSLRQKQSAGHTTVRIGGYIARQALPDAALVQVAITVIHDGEPTTLRDWHLVIHTREKNYLSIHQPGSSFAPHSLEIPRLDERAQTSIEPGSEITGYVTFLFPNVRYKEMVNFANNRSAEIIVSAHDKGGQLVEGRRGLFELAAEKLPTYSDRAGGRK